MVVDILHLVDHRIVEPDVLVWISVDQLAGFLELKLILSEFEDVADHLVHLCADHVVIVVLVELVSAVEDVINSLYVFSRIAYLPLHDPRLVHQQLVVNVNVLRP